MVETDGDDRGGRAAGTNGADDAKDAGLEKLRELLIGPELLRLDAFERELARKVRARDVSKVLPDALHMHRPEDGRLAQALEPHVGRAIQRSVRSNLGEIRDALLPVIGPVIRKYVRSALVSMLENMNRVLDHSFSIRGLRWRWEAWRTGRPFSEIVLLNSLKYRVEQLFLIHRESGLLLQHAAHPSVTLRDPDMVSGMMTAIREFMHDSFDAPESSDVTSVQLDDFRLLINADEHMALAAVVRGVPPEGLSRRLARTLERISADRRADLDEYQGDDTAFRASLPLLEDQLELELEEARPRLPVGTVAAATAALVGIAWLAMWFSAAYFRSQEWRRAFTLLQQEPGILLGTPERVDGRWFVAGFRDPFARSVEEVLSGLTIDLDLASFEWEEYASHEDAFALLRASAELSPPASVRLEVADNLLRVTGRAPAAWAAFLDANWRGVEGLRAIESSGLAIEP